MKRITNIFLAVTLSAFAFPTWVAAQTVFTLPQTGKADKDAATNPQKVTAAKQKTAAEAARDFTSPWPLFTEADRMAYGSYVADKGTKPAAPSFKVKKSPYGPEDDTKYTYTGFNQVAGLAADGTTQTGGLVNFNLKPFACDTVSSDAGVSPYSYMAKGKLYSFLPTFDRTTGTYPSLKRTVYDANTLVKLSEETIENPGGNADRMPYLISYDDARDVVYSISLGFTKDGVQPYYLNILDTATCKLQRIGKIGEYSTHKEKGNFSPKAFTATGGTLRVQVSDDSLYIAEINPITLELKTIGRTTMQRKYSIGLQPMIYDVNSGNLIINHYDFNNGTIYYKVAPYLAYGATDNVLKTEEIEATPTGFTYFYKRPETEPSYTKYKLADISDLEVNVPDGSSTASISFTVPDKDSNGNVIEVPSYAQKTLKLYAYVDNKFSTLNGLPATIEYGSKINATLDLTPGLHTVTVQLVPAYNDISQTRSGKNVVVGYDAPATVENPTLTVKNMTATITWKAPTTGKFADFGSTFDGSDLTYKVVRNLDGKVVADGIKATSVTDESLLDEIKTYSYTIYATSHGNTSFAAVTNEVSAGQYLPLPYSNDFSDSHSLDGWTIIDNDTPGTIMTWSWNYIYKNISTHWGIADDWIITPAFSLSKDKVYALRYDLQGSGNLRTTAGQGNTTDAQDIILDDVENYTVKSNEKTETKEYYFRPSENGKYNFGLYDYSLGENDHWIVDNVKVYEIASVAAPDKVRSLSFTPDAKGALGGTLSFKLPATDIAGNSISKLTKLVVYDLDGKEISTLTNVTPGAETSVKVTAVQGFNTYKVVAVNENGEGWPVLIEKYVGVDVPKTIKNLKLAWGTEQNIINITFDAPTEGVNGGYVDPSTYTYTLYKYSDKASSPYTKIAETPENDIELQLQGIPDDQNQYVIGITASNEEGESDYVREGIILGTPYELPFVEPFGKDGLVHQPYMLQTGKNSQAWTAEPGVFNDKIKPENNDGVQLLLRNIGDSDGSSRLIAPIIDFTKAENPLFSVWLHHSDAMPEGAYVTIDATVDGSKDYIAVSDTARLTGNNGWTEHIFDLSKLKGKKAQIALEGYLPDPATRIFADNWNIYEASGKDLALTAISQPYMPVVGDTATVSVTVTNKGAEAAQGYSVLFNVNGETVDTAEPDEALALGKSRTFNFTLPITSAKKDVTYSASVEYDGDENTANNASSEVKLSPKQLELPAPSDLTLNGNTSLVWNAPENMDGRTVTLDFEDVPAFTIDNIDGWKTVDGDGNLSTGFIQYYGNYWPYFNQPFAWMIWSAREAGCPGAKMWFAHGGEKCLVNFGNYGVDKDGRPNTNPNDDWFISPEVKGGTEFSLWSLSNEALSCSIDILASTTDNKPESFTTKVGEVTYSANATWSEYKFTLPADAKYVALHNVNNGFGLLVDDITYTEAKAPVFKGYNVYRDNSGVTQTTEAKAEADGNGTYAVSAVYDLGESELSNTVNVTAGIADLTETSAKVSGGNGIVTISGAEGKRYSVYTAGGVLVATGTAAQTENVKVSVAGIYLAKVDGKTFKVVVK